MTPSLTWVSCSVGEEVFRSSVDSFPEEGRIRVCSALLICHFQSVKPSAAASGSQSHQVPRGG